jgi:hypothetical protein
VLVQRGDVFPVRRPTDVGPGERQREAQHHEMPEAIPLTHKLHPRANNPRYIVTDSDRFARPALLSHRSTE